MDTTEAELGIEVDLAQEAAEVSSYDRGWWDGFTAAESEIRAEYEADLRGLEFRVALLQSDLRELANHRNRDEDGEDRQCSRSRSAS